MWRPNATGPYARIGRFYAPYGIRFVEHIFFIRRYAGSELYNETYTASGGYVSDEWELHLSAFTPPPTGFPDALQSVGARESGGAAYFEYRMNGMSALAAQARVGIGKEESRYQGGLVGKLWLEPAKLLFLGEADFIIQNVSAASYTPEPVRFVPRVHLLPDPGRDDRRRRTSASRRTCPSPERAATPTTWRSTSSRTPTSRSCCSAAT